MSLEQLSESKKMDHLSLELNTAYCQENSGSKSCYPGWESLTNTTLALNVLEFFWNINPKYYSL